MWEVNSLVKKEESHRKVQWSTPTNKITNKHSEELLHVNGFSAQYLSAFK